MKYSAERMTLTEAEAKQYFLDLLEIKIWVTKTHEHTKGNLTSDSDIAEHLLCIQLWKNVGLL